MIKQKISRGILEDMYMSIEEGKLRPRPKFVFFQGVKYRTGSNPLKRALDKWYEKHGKKTQ